MKKLSTGQDSTLRTWIELSNLVFGEDSGSSKFLNEKAQKSKNGLDEEVIADEGQLLNVLMEINRREME